MSYELELGDVSLMCKCGEPLELKRVDSSFDIGHKPRNDCRFGERVRCLDLGDALMLFRCDTLAQSEKPTKRSECIRNINDWTEEPDNAAMIEALALLCEEVEELVAITRLPLEAKNPT